jgi:DNA excision repair protein ERCC-3
VNLLVGKFIENIKNRPEFIHEYELTTYSLYAAISIGLEVSQILLVLDRLSKNEIPNQVKGKLYYYIIEYIYSKTKKFGNVKLILQKNKYFVESSQIEVLNNLLKDDVIKNSKIISKDKNFDKETGFIINKYSREKNEVSEFLEDEEGEELEEKKNLFYSFEIDTKVVSKVKEKSQELGI